MHLKKYSGHMRENFFNHTHSTHTNTSKEFYWKGGLKIVFSCKKKFIYKYNQQKHQKCDEHKIVFKLNLRLNSPVFKFISGTKENHIVKNTA